MKCPHCNKEHPAGTKFCPETGRGISVNVNDELHRFFPLYGITLGETTIEEIEAQSHLYDRIIRYETGCNHIWVGCADFANDPEYDVMTEVLLSDVPASWASNGFRWEASYIEWISVFSGMGYDIDVVLEPYVGYSNDEKYKCLHAEFWAKAPDETLKFHLYFKDGKDGMTVKSRKTLYQLEAYMFSYEPF